MTGAHATADVRVLPSNTLWPFRWVTGKTVGGVAWSGIERCNTHRALNISHLTSEAMKR